MSEKLEMLESKLKDLQEQKNVLIKEKAKLVAETPEVQRFIRVGFETQKIDLKMNGLQQQIKEETMLNCHHTFVKIDDKGNYYCIKCGLSNKCTASLDYLKMIEIYNATKDNSIIVNTDYACREEIVIKICSYIVETYPYISDDKLAHFVAVAIHNMQTKRKSDSIKRNRAKRLYLRPSFLEKSNML